MKNMAYTEEYAAYRREREIIFREDCFQSEELVAVSPQYRLRRRTYQNQAGAYRTTSLENELLDQDGRVVYAYRNLDHGADFCTVLEHSDGLSYLLFRTDLYGYSVLELSTLREFHFIPSGSFPTGESFIWTDAFYNPQNNVLAVSGCYWACPSGIVLQDFSHPLEEPKVWAEVHGHLDPNFERYGHIEFTAWRGTDLVLSAEEVEGDSEKTVTLTLPEEIYGAWLQEAWPAERSQ